MNKKSSSLEESMGNLGVERSQSEIVSELLSLVVVNLREALKGIQDGDISLKGERISKAISIVGILQGALVRVEGGEAIYDNLSDLYDYVMASLVESSYKNDQEKITECIGLIETLRSGWDEMLLT